MTTKLNINKIHTEHCSDDGNYFSVYHYYEILNLFKTDEEYSDLEVNFLVEVSKVYYLVVAFYKTGSSNSEEHGEIEIIDLFQTYDEAKAIAKQVRKNSDDYYAFSKKADIKGTSIEECKSYHTFSFENNGIAHELWAPWNGYFEHLEEVKVIPINLISELLQNNVEYSF